VLTLPKRSSYQSTLSSCYHNVIIPHAGINVFAGDDGSPSFGSRTGRPSPLDNKLAYLQSIPTSPPITIPSARLLESGSTSGMDVNARHSNASASVNITSFPSPPRANPGSFLADSPLLVERRRISADRRRSSLAHELNQLNFPDDTACPDIDNATDPITPVPAPNPASPAIARATTPSTTS
jgi:hypothetical protein